MSSARRGAGVLAAVLLATGCLPVEEPARVAASPAAAPSASTPAAPLLRQAARGGDGDSWRDTEGREYRLGMVNAPELGTCYGAQATAERKNLLAGGFRARVYATDRYGRGVSVVTTAAGVVVNVDLARRGLVDDRYLEQFRSEEPQLARQLDMAFAAAKAERAGLWRACAGHVAGGRTSDAGRS